MWASEVAMPMTHCHCHPCYTAAVHLATLTPCTLLHTQDEIIRELQEADEAFVGFEEELEQEERSLAEALGNVFPFLRGILGVGSD